MSRSAITGPNQLILIGAGPYHKALQQIFDLSTGVEWREVQSKRLPSEWDAKAILHVALVPRVEESVGTIREVHDLIWSCGWAIEASIAIILPDSWTRDELLNLDVFGNRQPQKTFKQLVNEGHHFLVSRAEARVHALASWFATAGIMMQESWSRAKERCSMLESLCVFLNDRETKFGNNMTPADLQILRQMARLIDWDKLGGSEPHAFARRIQQELLGDNLSTTIIADLRGRFGRAV